MISTNTQDKIELIGNELLAEEHFIDFNGILHSEEHCKK